MSISNNFPTTRPSLILDFQKSEVVDPRITFTRASSATRYNQYGVLETVANNVPRIDFSPTTLLCNGFLIEEQRTNLLLQSNTPDNLVSPWGIGPNTTRIGVTTAPDNSNTAVVYTGNGSGANEFINQVVSLSANTTYTCSIWARLVSGSVPTGGTIISATFNNGTSNVRSTVNYSGNLTTSWNRFSTTFTNVNALTNPSIFFNADQTNTAEIAIWGAQLEVGAFATSYIPTAAATVTRNADAASMTGTNFSSWFNASEGTLCAQGAIFGVPASSNDYRRLVALTGANVNTDEISIYRRASDGMIHGAVTQGATATFEPSVATVAVNVGLNSAIAYKTNDAAFALNGTATATDTSVTLPVCVSFQLGQPVRFQPMPNCYLRRVSYYPTRLSNAQLQALTLT